MALAILFLIFIGLGQDFRREAGQRYREALQSNPRDSLAHFRLGELEFQRYEFQSAANEFRNALNGEPHPKWIDGWAHFDLGEIFDITRQRDRGVREYEMAAGTRDDTDNLQALVSERLHRAATRDDIKRQGILAEDLGVPKVMKRVAPVYSPEARIAQLEGTVTLAATIAANGSVEHLRVMSPLGLGLDEAAEVAVAQWSFEPGKTKNGPARTQTSIELGFLFPAKRSRWHLLGVGFETPADTSRPHFVSAKYPGGSGISAGAAEEARLVAVMGRQELVQLSFDVDTTGLPVHFSIQKANPPWGKEAISLVRAWRFSAAAKVGVPVSVPCSIVLVWGERQFVESSLEWANAAFELGAVRNSSR
jgi:TonB family protein